MENRLRTLGSTQQRLLRHLLSTGGSSVETLCAKLRLSHNAIRQHLTALMHRDFVTRAQAQPSGGRPVAHYRLTEAGRDLFPRNYAAIATAILGQMHARMGEAGAGDFMRDLGRSLGRNEVPPPPDAPRDDVARSLAERLDALGYEATTALHGDALQVEAFNCVFHAMATQHPHVCTFDVAYMEAATRRRIHHMECMVRGGSVCRFRIGDPVDEETT
jgi:predicted ArsR family transcriptional regulator